MYARFGQKGSKRRLGVTRRASAKFKSSLNAKAETTLLLLPKYSRSLMRTRLSSCSQTTVPSWPHAMMNVSVKFGGLLSEIDFNNAIEFFLLRDIKSWRSIDEDPSAAFESTLPWGEEGSWNCFSRAVLASIPSAGRAGRTILARTGSGLVKEKVARTLPAAMRSSLIELFRDWRHH